MKIKDVLTKLHTVELQWLVYHGCFEFVLESLGKTPIAADMIIFGILKDVIHFILIMVCFMY